MSQYDEMLNENEGIFLNLIEEKDLHHLINFKILSCSTLTDLSKIIKTNGIIKYLTDIDVIILINETIFDMLDEQQKYIVADEILTSIEYNSEKDAVIIRKPNLQTFTGIIKKYSYPIYENLYETIRLIKEQLKEKENEKK